MVLLLSLLLWANADAMAPVSVRFIEGSIHGFLNLTTIDGKAVASGDVRQIAQNGVIEGRTEFRFKDGSFSEETVVFSQDRVFSMQAYRLVQRGPTFKEDTEISLERPSGKYRVTVKDHGRADEKNLSGTIELPADVYNGMIFTIAKNLPGSSGRTVHVVAFTPEPRLIELEILPAGKQKVMIDGLARTANHYVLRANLGLWLKFLTKLRGEAPVDDHVWILSDPVPAFVRFEGPMYISGPVWRMDLTTPHLSE
jgi:hypothetical protein